MGGADWWTISGFFLALVGLAVAIAGLVIALQQLRRTSNAVEAAGAAVERTERHLAITRLLALSPLLDRLEQELDLAVSGDDRRSAMRHLADWRSTANPIQGLIAENAHATPEVRDRLRESVVQAAQAKARLLDPRTSLRKATEQARQDMSAASDLVGELAGKLQVLAREEEADDR
jgi:hypothetical protein